MPTTHQFSEFSLGAADKNRKIAFFAPLPSEICLKKDSLSVS